MFQVRLTQILRATAVLTVLAAGVAIVAAVGSRATSNDYIEYWSSGKLFVQGVNPYSGSAILVLEKSHGFLLNSPLIMLNPPWTMPFIAWLGLCSEKAGLVLWVLCQAICIGASIFVLGIPPKYRTIAFVFAPVIGTFLMMQSSPLLLLGFALFLRLHRSRPYLGGAALSLMAIKPHLFLVFWIVLLAQSIYRRSFSGLAGMVAALGLSSAIATLKVPGIWPDYLALIRGSTLGQSYFPTLPTLLRVLIHPQWAWLSLLPSAIAIVWGLVYFYKRREQWDWKREGIVVMLVTVMTSPYSWISDQIVLLPALICVASPGPRRFAMESLVALNTAALVLICVGSQACMWLPLAWLLWYLYASAPLQGTDKQSAAFSGAV